MPRPKGRAPKDYRNWDGERGCWVDDAGQEQPSTLSVTVQPEPQPEPEPMTAIMQPPLSQPRILHAGLPSLAHSIVATDMRRDSMNVSDAWAHAIAVTNATFCTILSRVDDPDPSAHLSRAMHQRLSTYGLHPSAIVCDEEFCHSERTGRRRRWSR